MTVYAPSKVIDAVACFKIRRTSLRARIAVEELVCASRGRCTRRSLRRRACQVAEIVPLYRRILTPYVDCGMCLRPGEGEEVTRVGIKERINNIKRGQVRCTPDLFSRGERERPG